MYLESSQILLCIVFACALVIFIIILFLYSKGQQYEQYFKLQQSSERERIRIVEKERNRVAVELHDNICMQLLTVGMNLEVIEPDRQEHQSVLTSTKQHLGKLIDDLRKLSYEMLPVGVELKGNVGHTLFSRVAIHINAAVMAVQHNDVFIVDGADQPRRPTRCS